MLYKERIAVCSQMHTKHINTLCGQNVELYIKTQSVPRSKHSVSVIKTSQLMLYREIIAVCSQIHTKHINTLCGQNVEFFSVKRGGLYSYLWALKGYWNSLFFFVLRMCWLVTVLMQRKPLHYLSYCHSVSSFTKRTFRLVARLYICCQWLTQSLNSDECPGD